ncbi:hypothetical protein [uncultured Sphingomonas sp.]|uniref:hypothetical protein n=1 Tax=uncultured Sphingomonas sp. TaxID=158754 RepID=UPI0025E1716E|nr:hypothetical protein [uncultured Sphingomonas sp.]
MQAQLDMLVARARAHRMTPDERRAQRVSLVMGLRGANSTLTKEKVETLIEEFEGHAG